jgi:hypothetical protein
MRYSLSKYYSARLAVVAVLASLSACVTARPSYDNDVTPRALAMTGEPSSRRAARLAEFEERRRIGIGRFLTADVLQANDDIPLTDLIRLRIPGFSNARDARGNTLGSSACLNVYLNGLFSPNALEGLHSHDLAGVEFYDAVSAPQQYRRSGLACAALLLWTE